MKNQDKSQDSLFHKRIMEILSATSITKKTDDANLQQAYERSHHTIFSSIQAEEVCRKQSLRWKWTAIAASLAFIVLSSCFVYYKIMTSGSAYEMQMVWNGHGKMKQVILPDGSKVWLNAGTQLVYPDHFNGSIREVLVTGEAFFDVVKDKRKPFVVKMESIAVTVHGTRFNVKSYADDPSAEITLETGSVSFENKQESHNQEFYLIPSQRAEIFKETGKVTIEDVDTKFYTYWKEGNLYFKAKSFEDIAIILERKYNVRVDIRSDRLKSEVYTGKFENDEPIEKILELIRLNTPIKYQVKDSVYIITEKNS